MIQPLSGRSIFQDYLDKNPAGGVQYIAYSIPVAKLDKIISEKMAQKGFQVITSVNHPIAKIVFFDASKDIGVFTEIMGISEEGEKAVQTLLMGKSTGLVKYHPWKACLHCRRKTKIWLCVSHFPEGTSDFQ